MARRLLYMMVLGLVISGVLPVIAQEPGATDYIKFLPYSCTFNRAEASAEIHAVLNDPDGHPVPREAYRLGISDAQTRQILSPSDVRITQLPQRPPLRMIIVLDVTETVPLLEIKSALAEAFVPRLQAEDLAAVITFSSTVSETSTFLRDKNRLINDYVIDLDTQLGDNRIYNAILQAVTDLQTYPTDERKVVLVITDSGRRTNQQATIDEIITQARNSKIQIYPIGFYSRDKPDVDELRRIANETYGYAWMYTDEESTRASIQTAVAGFLEGLVTTLNSEVLIHIDSPKASPETPDLARYELDLALRSGEIIRGNVSCPIDQLEHSISFATTDFNLITSEPFDVAVTYATELADDEVTVAFWVDDQRIQNSSSKVFTFDTPVYQPGSHIISTQLLDLSNNVLATSEQVVTVYAQQQLRAEVIQGSFSQLDQPITINLTVSPQVNLPEVVMNIRVPESDIPYLVQEVSIVEGEGRITVRNLQEQILEFLPDAKDGDLIQVSLEAPAPSPSEPSLARPVTLTIEFDAPEPVVAPKKLPFFLRINLTTTQLMQLVSLALLLFNIVMVMRVRRLKIIKIINRPDKIELSDRLMTVTVRNEEGKKSYPLTRKTMTIGRGDTNDIDLGASSRISRRHGVIIWRKGLWWYTNRKGDTSAVIDGEKVKGYKLIPLVPITEIEFPDSVLVFHSSAQQDVSSLFNTDI